jgi:hypothetical protein
MRRVNLIRFSFELPERKERARVANLIWAVLFREDELFMVFPLRLLETLS